MEQKQREIERLRRILNEVEQAKKVATKVFRGVPVTTDEAAFLFSVLAGIEGILQAEINLREQHNDKCSA
jgi:hypothetical protein